MGNESGCLNFFSSGNENEENFSPLNKNKNNLNSSKKNKSNYNQREENNLPTGNKWSRYLNDKALVVHVDKPIGIDFKDDNQPELVGEKQKGDLKLKDLHISSFKGDSMRYIKAKSMIEEIFDQHLEDESVKNFLSRLEKGNEKEGYLFNQIQCQNGKTIWFAGWYQYVNTEKVNWCSFLAQGESEISDLLGNLIRKKMIGISQLDKNKLVWNLSNW